MNLNQTVILRRILLLTLICLTSACTTVYLAPRGINPDTKKLAALNRQKINVRVTLAKEFKTLGHQYLFLLIPYGQIQHHSVKQLISDAIYRELSISGFSPQIVFEESPKKVSSLLPQKPLLEINVKDLSLTAYDLLVTRKVTGRIDLTSKLILAKGETDYPEIRIQENYSEFKSLPFKIQLERILEKLIIKTMPEVIDVVKYNLSLIHI